MWALQSKKRVNLGVDLPKPVDSRENDEDKKDLKIDYMLASHSGDSRPFLEIRVFGAKVKALLDSGASKTILGKDGTWILEKFPVHCQRYETNFVETADASRHTISGEIKLQITLKGRTCELPVLVVPTLKHSLILGVDFWERMKLITNLHDKTWDFAPTKEFVATVTTEQGLKSGEHLTEDQKQILNELVECHFKQAPEGLGRTHLVEHVIDTGDAPPIKQRYYPMSPARLKIVNDELDKMLSLGVVEKSKSAWSSPIVLVDKPGGGTRFCINFQKVNTVTKRDAYPLPQVTMILDRLRDAKYLTTLDVKSAYWQIPLSKESRDKSAFTVPGRGLFEFVTMPFGLHNAAATWQRFIDAVIGADLEPHCFVYLDDIIVVTGSFERHIEVLGEIFQRVRKANISLNRGKCRLCCSELKYLGYLVDQRGLRVDPDKVEAIASIPVPKNQKEVRQFCGTASWYRRFIQNFAERMYPLTSLLKKRKRFEWTEEASRALEDIKSCLVTSPILTCPDFSKEFIISCDASGVGIGAVLGQTLDQGEVVVAYASRTLGRNEQKFSATERECIAVIWAVERFRPYVEGAHFTVVTDHHSLLWLHNLNDPQGRLARWILRLQPFNFTLVHRKGKDHVVPDILSRNPVQNSNQEEMVYTLEIPEEIKDKWYLKMVESVTQEPGKYPAWKMELGKLWRHVPSFNPLGGGPEEWKVVVPKECRREILHGCHDIPTAGHMGCFKTFRRLQLKYYWPKMRSDVSKYVSRCAVCQKVKYDQQKPTGLMGQRRGVDQPWKMVATDLMGPFPRSLRGFKYLLVVTDTFTKYTVLYPLRSATAKIVSKHLEEDVFLVYGVPQYLICDNGSEYIGAQFKNLMTSYKVQILYNPSRHPQSNPTERVNRNIITMLRAYIGDNHREWDKHLPQIGFALRTSVHEVTGYSPAFLNFGREPTASGDGSDFLEKEDIPEVENSDGHGDRLRELQKIFKDVRQRLGESHQKNSHHYNLRRRPLQFKEGDQVLKRNFNQSNATAYFSAKLTPRFVGPYRIKKKMSNLVYQLEELNGKSIGNWHIVDLKAYNT